MKLKLVEMRVCFVGENARVEMTFNQNGVAVVLQRTYQHSNLLEISNDVGEIHDRLNRFLESNRLEVL